MGGVGRMEHRRHTALSSGCDRDAGNPNNIFQAPFPLLSTSACTGPPTNPLGGGARTDRDNVDDAVNAPQHPPQAALDRMLVPSFRRLWREYSRACVRACVRACGVWGLVGNQGSAQHNYKCITARRNKTTTKNKNKNQTTKQKQRSATYHRWSRRELCTRR